MTASRKPALSKLNAKIESKAALVRDVALLPVSGYRVRVLAETINELRTLVEMRDEYYPSCAATQQDDIPAAEERQS